MLKVQYKCRRCGVVYSNMSDSNKTIEDRLLAALHNDLGFLAYGIPQNMQDLHQCKDGLGIADLIGAIYAVENC